MSHRLAKASLHNRLLHDINELHQRPYPNIALQIPSDTLTHACLILTSEAYGAMHMTVTFPPKYPLSPPQIKMNSRVHHPNIFNEYICASILNTEEGWTPAYTLKSIAIQLLSFFSSESVEQVGGGNSVKLKLWRESRKYVADEYTCDKCDFGSPLPESMDLDRRPDLEAAGFDKLEAKGKEHQQSKDRLRELVPRTHQSILKKKEDVDMLDEKNELLGTETQPEEKRKVMTCPLIQANLPDEVLIMLLSQLDHENMISLGRAWQRLRQVMADYDVIRTRELQCFCLKKDFISAKLGVGVSYSRRGTRKSIASEFDLLSEEAFVMHRIRRSVQGIPFDEWLPLPISYGHWRKVRQDATIKLLYMAKDARLTGSLEEVVYHFMNGVVVDLNEKTAKRDHHTPQSSLTHVSEKAIESYFHLFHLLLCLAAETPETTQKANQTINGFMAGANSKNDCPSLGYFLISALISDVEMTQEVLTAIVKETTIRNVVWVLDKKGTGNSELSYLEPSAVSKYRMRETFKASKTSYRILMFLNLFRRTAVGSPRKPLIQLRDEAFDRHGAPPRGSAKDLADSIKKIHDIDSFDGFFEEMGMAQPSPQELTSFLRQCIEDSMAKGYSYMPISQGQALFLRLQYETRVEIVPGLKRSPCYKYDVSFFPNARSRYSGHNGGNGRGRGRGRG